MLLMGTGRDVVIRAVQLDSRGGRYVFGAKGPTHFDCSGFTYEAARLAGGSLVHGAQPQRDQLRRVGKLVTVSHAMKTPGALLFRIDERPGNDHVAISVGNGSTVEAHSTARGIGLFSAQGRRWTHGGLIPGISYGGGNPVTLPANKRPATTGAEALAAALRAAVRQAKGSVLAIGSRGDHVKILQQGLNNTSGAKLKVDGVFGAATQQAVRNVQRWVKIPVTGTSTRALWDVLFPGV